MCDLKSGLLGVLENSLELGSLHHVTLNLQLAAHEELLCVRLLVNKVTEVLVGEEKGDIRLATWGRGTLSDFAGLLQVKVPRLSLALGVLLLSVQFALAMSQLP
jgi:hypothetical protein